MCSIELAFTAISTIASYIGQQQQAKAEAKAMEAQAATNRQNAALAEKRAEDALQRGDIEEKQKRLESARLRATQQTGFAAGGVLTSEGTPLDVSSDTAALGELDALTIRSNASREAFEHEVDAFNFNSAAGANIAAANNRRRAGVIEGAGTILGGASNLYDRYRRLNPATT